MGRFGNVMLINGETEFSAEVAQGEVVRLYLVNTANTRIFNVAVSGARTKLVGGDSGRYEHETFVDEVLLAPSERAVLDVLFDTPGTSRLEHRTPDRTYDLGRFHVAGTSPGQAVPSFEILRNDPDLTAERQRIEHDMERAPDKVLGFTSLMPLLYGQGAMRAATVRLSHAPRGHGRGADDVPEVWDETGAVRFGRNFSIGAAQLNTWRCRCQATVSSGRI